MLRTHRLNKIRDEYIIRSCLEIISIAVKIKEYLKHVERKKRKRNS